MGKCGTLQCCIQTILCASASVAGITRIPTHLNQNSAAVALDTEGGSCIVCFLWLYECNPLSTLGRDKGLVDAVPLEY